MRVVIITTKYGKLILEEQTYKNPYHETRNLTTFLSNFQDMYFEKF